MYIIFLIILLLSFQFIPLYHLNLKKIVYLRQVLPVVYTVLIFSFLANIILTWCPSLGEISIFSDSLAASGTSTILLMRFNWNFAEFLQGLFLSEKAILFILDLF